MYYIINQGGVGTKEHPADALIRKGSQTVRSTMKNLLELRDEIDVIDKQIVALYQQRMQIAAEVAEYKIETGKKVFDKDREMEKLAMDCTL